MRRSAKEEATNKGLFTRHTPSQNRGKGPGGRPVEAASGTARKAVSIKVHAPPRESDIYEAGGLTMDKEIVEVPVLSAAIRSLGIPLSPVVKANGFVFVSGLPPLDLETGKMARGDIAAQTELVLKNVQRALESAGSSLDKVVKVNLYAANSGYFNLINEVYARFFPQRPPARTFVAVGSWPLEFDVEIECVALA
jgi:2-iminobutanoate/2-iminopropanoate deaminase